MATADAMAPAPWDVGCTPSLKSPGSLSCGVLLSIKVTPVPAATAWTRRNQGVLDERGVEGASEGIRVEHRRRQADVNLRMRGQPLMLRDRSAVVGIELRGVPVPRLSKCSPSASAPWLRRARSCRHCSRCRARLGVARGDRVDHLHLETLLAPDHDGSRSFRRVGLGRRRTGELHGRLIEPPDLGLGARASAAMAGYSSSSQRRITSGLRSAARTAGTWALKFQR